MGEWHGRMAGWLWSGLRDLLRPERGLPRDEHVHGDAGLPPRSASSFMEIWRR